MLKTPYAMAKQECAKFCGGRDRAAECLSNGQCLLAKPGGTCEYFERAVLPMAKARPAEFRQAVDAYMAKGRS